MLSSNILSHVSFNINEFLCVWMFALIIQIIFYFHFGFKLNENPCSYSALTGRFKYTCWWCLFISLKVRINNFNLLTEWTIWKFYGRNTHTSFFGSMGRNNRELFERIWNRCNHTVGVAKRKCCFLSYFSFTEYVIKTICFDWTLTNNAKCLHVCNIG